LKNKENEKVIFTKTNKLLNQEIEIHNRTLRIRYKMVGFSDNEYVKNMSQYNSMVHFLFDQLEKSQEKMYYCQEEDYDKFASQYRIFEVLMDIKCHVDLNDSRVECYVQPIFEIESQCFRTAEALMRLSIDGKTIYPDQFIELAEEHNCIHELTCIMLNKVCKNINLMQEKYKFDAITVNCSTSEFSNYKLHSELLEIIKKNKISPSKIRLELTESTMYDDYAAVLHNMSKLKMEGVEFYLDDFGTGYSNLERIISCPFRTIKFDKSLLYKAIEDRNLNALVISMVQVFKQQGIVLLMEGVENEKQRDYTIKAGFDYIQGYFYSKPVPIAKLKDVFEPVE
jgi:EAL domain-containing protein (putative c-di-GMP-specific phosphodiesterase class I)